MENKQIILKEIKETREKLTSLEKQFDPDTPSTIEKVIVYENLLHQIQLYAQVVLHSEKVSNIIKNICDWSYAHRCGNGMFSEQEQQSVINQAFRKLEKEL